MLGGIIMGYIFSLIYTKLFLNWGGERENLSLSIVTWWKFSQVNGLITIISEQY